MPTTRKPGGGSQTAARSTNKGSAPRTPAARPESHKVMVALAGIDGGRGNARDEKYQSMRALAKERRDRVVAWLAEQDVRGEYKRVSQPTAFGTFTLECTPNVMRLLRRAPHVESVTRVDDVPLELVSS